MCIGKTIIAVINKTNPEYIKHSKIMTECFEKNLEVPEDTADYFETNIPDLDVIESKLKTEVFITNFIWDDNGDTIWSVHLKDLPPHTDYIIFKDEKK